jgi:hypothetical protein
MPPPTSSWFARLSGSRASVFFAFASSLGALVWLARDKGDFNLYLIAPAQAILGGVVFLTGVTVIVTVFARLGLHDKTNALALPEGSVRALLALVLLVIFVIFANIIFGNLSERDEEERRFQNLSAVQVARLGGTVTSQREVGTRDGAPTYDGVYFVARGEEAAQLGQQIVTGLLTLVATISAFYFGTGSLSSAANTLKRTTGQGDLSVLLPSQPVSLSRNDDGTFAPMEIKLGGSALDDAGAKATLTGDQSGRVESSGAPDVFVYTAGDPSGPVTLTFTSLANPSVKAELVVGVPPPLRPPRRRA